MNLKPSIAIILLLAIITLGQAQPQSAESPNPPQPAASPQMPPRPIMPAPVPPDLMEQNFFPPELIMQHQKALGLTEEQQTAIRGEMQKVMPRFTELQWQQSAEAEAMAALLKQERPNEKEVLAQLDKLLNLENKIRRLHTGLLVRLKNTLTPQQQAQLRGHTLPMHPGRITITGPVRNNFVMLLPGEEKKLLETILQAGPSEMANLKKVKLMRVDSATGKTEVKVINVEAIKKDPAKDVLMFDGDRLDLVEKNVLFQ
jgi:Spy/CpxP family protein refolding chaperone